MIGKKKEREEEKKRRGDVKSGKNVNVDFFFFIEATTFAVYLKRSEKKK